jgi:hypothetical protein
MDIPKPTDSMKAMVQKMTLDLARMPAMAVCRLNVSALSIASNYSSKGQKLGLVMNVRWEKSSESFYSCSWHIYEKRQGGTSPAEAMIKKWTTCTRDSRRIVHVLTILNLVSHIKLGCIQVYTHLRTSYYRRFDSRVITEVSLEDLQVETFRIA